MKQVVGVVVSNKMQKSVVVAVDRLFHHSLFNRYVKRTSKFMAHDEHSLCNIGDRVCFSLFFFFCLLLYNYTIRVLGLRFVLQLTIWKLKLAGEIGPFSASEQAQALGRR